VHHAAESTRTHSGCDFCNAEEGEETLTHADGGTAESEKPATLADQALVGGDTTTVVVGMSSPTTRGWRGRWMMILVAA
jgi:hypothetical protein